MWTVAKQRMVVQVGANESIAMYAMDGMLASKHSHERAHARIHPRAHTRTHAHQDRDRGEAM